MSALPTVAQHYEAPPASETRLRVSTAMTYEWAARQYRPLVSNMARRFAIGGVEPEDLAQEGYIALFACVDTWRADGGASFPSYAMLRVRAAISQAALRARRGGLGGDWPTVFPRVSMDGELDESGTTLHELLGGDASQEGALGDAEEHHRFRVAVASLAFKERAVMEGHASGLTLEEIGAQMGFTRERARQILKVATGRLRKVVRRRGKP